MLCVPLVGSLVGHLGLDQGLGKLDARAAFEEGVHPVRSGGAEQNSGYPRLPWRIFNANPTTAYTGAISMASGTPFCPNPCSECFLTQPLLEASHLKRDLKAGLVADH